MTKKLFTYYLNRYRLKKNFPTVKGKCLSYRDSDVKSASYLPRKCQPFVVAVNTCWMTGWRTWMRRPTSISCLFFPPFLPGKQLKLFFFSIFFFKHRFEVKGHLCRSVGLWLWTCPPSQSPVRLSNCEMVTKTSRALHSLKHERECNDMFFSKKQSRIQLLSASLCVPSMENQGRTMSDDMVWVVVSKMGPGLNSCLCHSQALWPRENGFAAPWFSPLIHQMGIPHRAIVRSTSNNAR